MASLSRIEAITRSFRRRVLAREKEAATQMADSYRRIAVELDSLIEGVQSYLEARRAAGQSIRPGTVFREQRLRALLQQAQGQIEVFTHQAESVTREAIRDAIRLGLAGAESIGAYVTPAGMTWHTLPTTAITALEGALQPQSPLPRLFREMGEEQAARLAGVLRRALAVGRNPKVTARMMRSETGMMLKRALLISRTEMLRAYREATRESYRENEHLVAGYQWVATLSGTRTCAACLAMHGTYHQVSETFGTHPRCRCTMVPVLRSDLTRARTQERRGEEWLRAQPREHQEAVLGVQGARLWREGKLELSDFVLEKRSRDWGLTRSTASVSQAIDKHVTRTKGGGVKG